MIAIPIEGADHAIEAGHWCNEHFNKNWGINLVGIGTNKYEFTFNNESDALMFTLRWL